MTTIRCCVGMLVGSVLLIGFEKKAEAQLRIDQVQKVAEMAVGTTKVPHRSPFVRVENGSLGYCLGDVLYQPLTGRHAGDYYPLLGMMRIELIRRSYTGGPERGDLNEAFWEPAIQQATQTICHEIQLISEWPQKDDPALLRHLSQDNDRLDGVFHERLARYAKQNNLRIHRSEKGFLENQCAYLPSREFLSTTAATSAATIMIDTSPEDCALYLMPALDYIMEVAEVGIDNVRMPLEALGKHEPLKGQFVIKMINTKTSAEMKPTTVTISTVGNVTFVFNGSPRVK